MGGGNRRSKGRGKPSNNGTPNNPKSRKKRGSDVKTALFVEGGFLSDWHLPSPTHTPAGRSSGLRQELVEELRMGLTSGTEEHWEIAASTSLSGLLLKQFD